jgi:hypothetical protein
MNCDRARCLLDDYAQSHHGHYERQRLEAHLASCPRCSDELRNRLALDGAVWQALAGAVQHQTLSSQASARIVSTVQGTLRQAIWSHRVFRFLQAVATVAATALVLIGLFFLLQNPPTPTVPGPTTLLPSIKLALSKLTTVSLAPASVPALPDLPAIVVSPQSQPAMVLEENDLWFEPQAMHPGEWFTITLVMHNNLPQLTDDTPLDLEISGPSGRYSFPLVVQGPLPVPGVTVVQLTPAELAEPCEQRYLITPTELFETPGIYSLRLTLFSSVSSPQESPVR